MSTLIEIGEEERQPLLHNPRTHGNEEEIVASSSSIEPDALKLTLNDSGQRLLSLDVFRGLTVALMILVDDAGGAFPSINHAPWFGLTIADFVMPFFLFGVGVSISLVFKKTSSKPLATKKVILRTIKLFLLGLFLQGGYFHGRNNLTYGVDMVTVRWLGVLQRISIGYLLASISEIWLVKNVLVDSPAAFVRKYFVQWIVATLLLSFYMCLLYGLYVPNWEFQPPSLNLSTNGSHAQIVQCGVKGSLEPPCNAVGYIDRYFLGEEHLYRHPVYRRTKECSVNSPDYGPLPPDSPEWCLAPFDPEGILSSLMAVLTCFAGLHFGHILLHCKGQMHRVLVWSMSSFTLLISGLGLEVLGIPFSKPLYTLSYMCITAGASTLILTIIFYIVDVKHFGKPVVLLQWMGMNALIIYALAACDIFPAAVQGFYWGSPENNLLSSSLTLKICISYWMKTLLGHCMLFLKLIFRVLMAWNHCYRPCFIQASGVPSHLYCSRSYFGALLAVFCT
ncbi:heparan-alpha-glucosaminide N-acetyltransferase-like isoform X2 [Durio zibethinus]|uniref:Heparan-alpha-glucosaminide N-acetyltransferase-like isoform X2 n=1 Tax=Durio zibethinus TaxID=66656 RepID=A0A6P5XJL2_DURZI|nr:heparan-alpha-glucosaminide N-acetyltransferase-like isoform X2 [Durio zibethinus]